MTASQLKAFIESLTEAELQLPLEIAVDDKQYLFLANVSLNPDRIILHGVNQ
jgi:hypothetical protein